MGGICIFKDSCQRQESGVGVPGELRGPSSGRSSQCIEGRWGEGESLGWVVAFEEVDIQKWEFCVRGLKGRHFLRIWEILIGNNVCLRELGPGVGFPQISGL